MPRTVDIKAFIDERPISPYQWLLVVLCFLVVMADGMDVAIMGFVTPPILQDWNISRAVFGFVISAAPFGLVIGALLAGPSSDRFGRRIVLIVAVLAFALLTIAAAFASTPLEMAVLRILAGMGMGAAMPNSTTLLSEYAPLRRRALMITVMFTGFNLGSALIGFAAGYLIPLYGWRSVMILGGGVPLALVPALVVFLPESARLLALRGAAADRIARVLGRVTGHRFAGDETFVSVEPPVAAKKPIAVLFSPGFGALTGALWVRNRQIAAIGDPAQRPRASELRISDDELRASVEENQLRQMRERGLDLTIFSPRASFMAHHIGDLSVSSEWAAICNALCFRVAQLLPDHFAAAAMLPQSPGVDTRTCLPELDRCVKDYGVVGINLNPDPSGGHWRSPPLTDRYWYPIYERMVDHDIPAMIHVSTSCNACFHTTGAHYINADTTAVMQLIEGDLFADFPTLRFVVPHGGGAAPYHWGRYRGLAQAMKKPLLKDHLLGNVFFDTCVYHQPGIDLLTRVIPVDNILFASEMIGAVRGIDPETGHNFDDTKRYVDATANLSDADRHKIFEGNARRVYPRLDAALKARGH